MRQFYRTPPDWLESTPLASPDGIARVLQDLRGQTPISDLCERSRRSRFQISRWISGTSEPRLPDFLCVLEAASLRLLDFLAALVDPTKLPSVAPAWSQLQRARRAAYEMPWSHAVLRVLELEQYRALPAHRAGWIGSRLGLSLEEEERCLEMLERTGQIERVGTRYVVAQVLTVDTRQNRAAGRKLKAWWSRVALERIERGEEAEGLFSYNLFSVSEADYQRLRELHLAYFRQLRSIVARSQPAERVVLANVQLFGLDSSPDTEI
jgi:hypothetical protein